MQTFENERYRDLVLDLAGHSYRGRSIGSEATCHQFPSYDCVFDIGSAPMSATSLSHVFITHGHEDHAGGVVKHALRRDNWGLPPATYYADEENIMPLRAMYAAQKRLHRSGQPHITLRMLPVARGDEIRIGANLYVRPFLATHRIPCLGYALWSKRKKLLPQFHGLPGPEIVELKKQGTVIDTILEVPEVAYPGDTNQKIFRTESEAIVKSARLLILECSFLDDEVTTEKAFRTGHIHIDDLVVEAEKNDFQNEVILLTHFSARYGPEYIRRCVSEKLRYSSIESRVRLLLP